MLELFNTLLSYILQNTADRDDSSRGELF